MTHKLLAIMINGQIIDPPAGIPSGGFSNGTAPHIIQGFIGLLFIITILLALFFLIFGGIRWMTSGGDVKAIESAKRRILFSLIGLGLVFFSYFILSIFSTIFRIPLIPGSSIAAPGNAGDPCTTAVHPGPC